MYIDQASFQNSFKSYQPNQAIYTCKPLKDANGFNYCYSGSADNECTDFEECCGSV